MIFSPSGDGRSSRRSGFMSGAIHVLNSATVFPDHAPGHTMYLRSPFSLQSVDRLFATTRLLCPESVTVGKRIREIQTAASRHWMIIATSFTTLCLYRLRQVCLHLRGDGGVCAFRIHELRQHSAPFLLRRSHAELYPFGAH